MLIVKERKFVDPVKKDFFVRVKPVKVFSFMGEKLAIHLAYNGFTNSVDSEYACTVIRVGVRVGSYHKTIKSAKEEAETLFTKHGYEEVKKAINNHLSKSPNITFFPYGLL